METLEVYVLTLEIKVGSDYGGWTSVHRSIDGARKRIEDRIDEWGLADQYAVARAAEVENDACIASGEGWDPIVYGITRTPVEP